MTDATDFVELARIWRGPAVESVHSGAVVVTNFDGRLVGCWGDAGTVTFPRSSLKPFQAIGLVESGAADALGLSDEHIALACASHGAESFQVALVQDWLGRLGLDESALVCGPALPRGQDDIVAACQAGGPRRIYHNCSGKHCGFLSVAKQLGAGLDYANPANPAQQLYMDVLSEYLGRDARKLPMGHDHCGLPAAAVPMRDMATAMARLAVGWSANNARRAAAKRVVRAMTTHPDHLSGMDAATSRLVRATNGKVVLKGGAEGFLLAAAPERGLGFAIKVADGASRVKWGVLARMLGHYGVLPVAEAEALIQQVEPPVPNSNGSEGARTQIVLEQPVPTTPTEATLAFWMGGVKEALFP
ncbi:asparaginase [Falsiroseomonas ponticola]|uniref:asparaginase n=1 Tax=Falsiroseomonas ponticola TaxID=2786951 RepID=UPI0019320678|nr:asparaginase [Roseomonas ponticola]